MEFIREHADRRQSEADGGLRWGVEPICAVLSEHGLPIAPSTYYERLRREPTPGEQRDEALLVEIHRVHRDNYGVYGARKVWLTLNREGIVVARCTVERLMRAAGLTGARRGKVKKTTIADPAGHRAADLVGRCFSPTAPDRLWVADLTYVSTWSGWVYVAFVTDAYARRILGWRCGTTMSTQLVLDALEQAIWTRHRTGAGLRSVVAHSDRGSQYTSLRYGERLAEAGITPSVGSVGRQLRQRSGRDDQRPVQDRTDQAARARRSRGRLLPSHQQHREGRFPMNRAPTKPSTVHLVDDLAAGSPGGQVGASLQSSATDPIPMASTSEQSLPGLANDPTPVLTAVS